MTTAHRPTRYRTDDNLGHHPNQPLALKNVKTTGARGINLLGRFALSVLVSVFAPNALVAAGAKRPTSIFGRWSIACQNHRANVTRLSRVIECRIQLIYGVWPESIANFWSIEGDTYRTDIVGPVIGNVGKAELIQCLPLIRVKDFRNVGSHQI